MMKISESANTPAMNDDELTRVFNEIDDDGNGYITPREAKKAFKKLAEKFNINRVSTYILHFYGPLWQYVLLRFQAVGRDIHIECSKQFK